jgi:hypothetical protein
MPILDSAALVSELGSRAVDLSMSESSHNATNDNLAIAAIMDRSADDRVIKLRKWLEYYKPFQGLTNDQRDSISQGIIAWIDSREKNSRLGDLHSLLSAHTSLVDTCVNSFGRKRNFTSLASKALWLRYPYDVPLYDRYAQQALCVVAKITPELPRVRESADSYEAFALVWRAFYDRHVSDIVAIPHKGYPYSVRIFDRILWMLSAPKYTVDSALGMAKG